MELWNDETNIATPYFLLYSQRSIPTKKWLDGPGHNTFDPRDPMVNFVCLKRYNVLQEPVSLL